MAGDFNQWHVTEKLAEFCDIQEVPSPPTRGNRKIDKIFVNWIDDIHDSGCLPPLRAELLGDRVALSDHSVQYACARVEKKEPVKWEKFTYRPFSDKGAAKFKSGLEAMSWQNIKDSTDPNRKAELLQAMLDDLTNECLPEKTIRRKDDDLPWINETAKAMIGKKRAIFKAEGQSARWEAQRLKVERYLETRRSAFLKTQKEKFIGPQASANFFKNVRAFKSCEKPKAFDVRDLRPGVDDQSVADEVAAFFNKISCEFSPLEPSQIPMTYHCDLPLLSESDVADMLRAAKKTKSKVCGDIFPSLINDCSDCLSVPLSNIYNSIISTYKWPDIWKREYVSTIPKKNIPSSFADLRNISCTLFFSKVFESYLMKQLLSEISLKPNQFGGVRGCSTTHMVVSILQEICSNAEDYRAATLLTAIDYAKAFNRVSYQHCLEALRKKGASSPTIRLVASFLTNRTMTVKVGESWSSPLPVHGGCPQGSVLGVLLFNATTDGLEDDFLHQERLRLCLQSDIADVPPPTPTGPVGDAPSSSTPTHPSSGIPPLELSPITSGGLAWQDMRIEFRPNVVKAPVPSPALVVPPGETAVGTQVLQEKPVIIFKYVDDNISCEKINFGNIPISTIDGKPVKVKQAIPSQNAFRSVTGNAGKLGMLVNASKTGLLCVSDAMNYTPMPYILDADNNRIECIDELKILGFTFSSKPTVSAHVASVVRCMRQRTWSLRHLGQLGFSQEDLVKVYCSLLLPIADYCGPAYHSMTTDIHDQELEGAQTEALRAIYGYGQSARKLRQRAGVDTLRERRIAATDKFASKCLNSPRFCTWFPLKTGRVSTRTGEKYQEFFAKSERLKNSPLYYMRRRLNGKEGKIYGERNKMYRQNLNMPEE